MHSLEEKRKHANMNSLTYLFVYRKKNAKTHKPIRPAPIPPMIYAIALPVKNY